MARNNEWIVHVLIDLVAFAERHALSDVSRPLARAIEQIAPHVCGTSGSDPVPPPDRGRVVPLFASLSPDAS